MLLLITMISSHVDFRGTYSSAVDCGILPRPGRKIPVMFGANKPRMLKLTARYADSWNANGLGQVAGLAPKRAELEAAASEVGRDPSTLAITAGINIAFPDLGDVPAGADDPARFLSGSVDEIATGLRGFIDQGVSHAMAWLYPLTDETIGRYAEAVSLARS